MVPHVSLVVAATSHVAAREPLATSGNQRDAVGTDSCYVSSALAVSRFILADMFLRPVLSIKSFLCESEVTSSERSKLSFSGLSVTLFRCDALNGG